MKLVLPNTIDRIRQPEYTGENRCIPCTSVNVVIAAVFSLGAGLLFVPLGVVVFAASLLSIYLRGYLVPGTPTLTKRYFPDWVLAKFDKEPADETESFGVNADVFETTTDGDGSDGTDGGRSLETDGGRRIETDGGKPVAADDSSSEDLPDFDDLDAEELFLEHGVVEPTAEDDDLQLTADVREVWRERMADRRDGDRVDQLASFFDVDAADLELSHHDKTTAVNVLYEGRLAGKWESDAAILADLAAADILGEWLPGWESYPLQPKSAVVSGLRAFAETCPDCEGKIELEEEIVESCCRTHEVYAVTCNDCEARLLEISRMQGKKPRPTK
ncbi:hypothetical protein OB955_04560 [Halobacteria archaeon AArc-m2/3/4]|uniref:Uncharacterized protein n=1 Tax=Natronoglomus mannanivorans TaxID=2979990 RepID=A0ABT2QAQ4_9EURY|nr:hypothetical protein [Halobacteria archaeon AArc-m2/3/4]